MLSEFPRRQLTKVNCFFSERIEIISLTKKYSGMSSCVSPMIIFGTNTLPFFMNTINLITLQNVFHQYSSFIIIINTNTKKKQTNKLRGLSPQANYTDRAAAAGRRSKCQLLRIEGCHVVSATGPHSR